MSGLITDSGGMTIGSASINRTGNVEMQYNAAGNVRFFGNATAGNIVTIATSGLVTAKTFTDGFITFGNASLYRSTGNINLQSSETGSNGVIIQGSRFYNNGLVVGSTTLAASAALEVNSTTRGILFPRMTSTQASAISSPADGLMIYVTDTNGTFTSIGFWGRENSVWIKL